MPLERSEAFILRTFNVGEQDKIAVFLTREKGILRGIAKGARKFGNRFGSSLEPLSRVNMFYYEKEHRDLVVVSNCDLIESSFDLQDNLERAATLAYFAELIEEFSPARAREDILFRLLEASLSALKAGGKPGLIGAYFEAWILKINGVLPAFHKCRKCRQDIRGPSWMAAHREGVFCRKCAREKTQEVPEDMSGLVAWVSKNPPSHIAEMPIREEKITDIRRILQDILIYHMEKEPKSLRLLK